MRSRAECKKIVTDQTFCRHNRLCSNFFQLIVCQVSAGTVALNISYEGLLIMVLLIMKKKKLLPRNILNLRLESAKTIPY